MLPESSYTHLEYCGECRAIIAMPKVLRQQSADCPRCHHTLRSGSRWGLHRCGILAISILILMPFTLTFPLLTVDLLGDKINASLWDGIWKMATQGYQYSAFLVFICSVFMPIAFAILVLLLYLAKILEIQPRNLLIALGYIKPWVMFDVYLVALAVSAFKVREYATLQFNVYLIAFILTALLTTLLFIKINPTSLWREFYPEQRPLRLDKITAPICFCRTCEYTFTDSQQHDQAYCPRCSSRTDIPDSVYLQRTWAALIAGMIMLIPANLLPISLVYMGGIGSGDTLMSGVISFIDMGSYFVAAVVFIASIFVPIGKILIMLYLLACVHFRWRHSIKWQMNLLHIVHFVGRWSMLDLFVLALMMSLVTRGQLIEFSVGPAAFYFGISVFLTMIATAQFDSRLLWNIYEQQHTKQPSQ